MTRCPFCGATDKDLTVDKFGFYMAVKCTNCDASGPSAMLRQQAIDVWNTRKETT
jgi:Lar family restriction alleviation protein